MNREECECLLEIGFEFSAPQRGIAGRNARQLHPQHGDVLRCHATRRESGTRTLYGVRFRALVHFDATWPSVAPFTITRFGARSVAFASIARNCANSSLVFD